MAQSAVAYALGYKSAGGASTILMYLFLSSAVIFLIVLYPSPHKMAFLLIVISSSTSLDTDISRSSQSLCGGFPVSAKKQRYKHFRVLHQLTVQLYIPPENCQSRMQELRARKYLYKACFLRKQAFDSRYSYSDTCK